MSVIPRSFDADRIRSGLAELDVLSVLRLTLTFVILLIWLIPILALFYISLKSTKQLITEAFWGRPEQIQLFANLATAWTDANFREYAINSFIYATVGSIGAVFLASLAGFATAKLDLPGGNKLFYVFFLFSSFPHQMYLIPLVKMFNLTNLYNTRTGLTIVYLAVAIPFAVYLLRNYFVTLPSSLYEAARIDGLSKLQIFWRIYLPLAKPALAVGIIFQWVWIWNNLLFGLVLAKDSGGRPIAAGLVTLTGRSPNWSVLAAATLIAVIPTLLVFIIFQRYFIQGLLAGTKG